MDQRRLDELATLLAHPDMRVRQEAQFALAGRGPEAIATLRQVAQTGNAPLARLHAVWGLGQVGRKTAAALDPVVALLDDADAEVRAQAAKVLGDARRPGDAAALMRRLADDSPRVRFFAAIALGKLGPAARARSGPLLEVLRENQDADLYLRHAAVMGLAGMCRPRRASRGGRRSLGLGPDGRAPRPASAAEPRDRRGSSTTPT